MLRWLTAGESHGPALVGVLEGLPAGVAGHHGRRRARALARRRLGYGRGARMTFEQDEVDVPRRRPARAARQGGPVAIEVGNTEWPKWETVMSRRPGRPGRCSPSQARNAPLTRPRPGHADLVGMQKYGFDDARPVLERASARETAARVALGAVAAAFLAQAVGVAAGQPQWSIGPVAVPGRRRCPVPDDVERARRRPGALPRRREPAPRWSPRSTPPQATATPSAASSRCVVYGLPPGLGSHVHWDRRLDARLAGALMGIQAIKGVEVGDGFADGARAAARPAHDEIERGAGRRCAAAPAGPAAPRAA